jgi:ferredoxin
VITQIELIEIFMDGAFGTHRILYHTFHENSIFNFIYTTTISFIEIGSILAFIATIAFLARRNLLKLPRFTKPEMMGWPTKDANLILIFEIYLITCIFSMNIADQAMYMNENGHGYGFLVSGFLAPMFQNLPHTVLEIWERLGWWGHIIGVFGFMIYLPHSKHLHILLAFPNTYLAKLTPNGQLSNLEAVTKEIKIMMNPDTAFAAPAEADVAPVKFGAKDVFDLSQKSLLDAYTCTECGRCTSACPANQTGKKLSPRKIMMDTRDRLEEVGRNIDANAGKFVDDSRSLLDYISVEELRACTTCNACVQECPVLINPLDIIMELRRHLILEESNSPDEWNGMFANIENNSAPWQFSQQDRLKWEEN